MFKILLLPGDGIGPEVILQAEKIINFFQNQGIAIEIESHLVGGHAIEVEGCALPEITLKKAKQADAVIFGAVGGDKWDALPQQERPEKALLTLRKELDLFANLRPAILYPQLTKASSLKSKIVENLDLLIVRELTSGIYFGEPRGVITKANGEQEGFNTYRYTESEIRRVARVAFEQAMKRGKKVCSVDKANVLEVTNLWRQLVAEEAKNYPQIELRHMYVDNAAMQLVAQPKQFDVLLTGNMFGDILSDIAAILTGSIGMLPSASINANHQGLYEPVHGSAPDIAGQDKANPLATILSLAMLFRSSLHLEKEAQAIEQAVRNTIAKGLRTADIAENKQQTVGCQAMGDEVIRQLQNNQNLD